MTPNILFCFFLFLTSNVISKKQVPEFYVVRVTEINYSIGAPIEPLLTKCQAFFSQYQIEVIGANETFPSEKDHQDRILIFQEKGLTTSYPVMQSIVPNTNKFKFEKNSTYNDVVQNLNKIFPEENVIVAFKNSTQSFPTKDFEKEKKRKSESCLSEKSFFVFVDEEGLVTGPPIYKVAYFLSPSHNFQLDL